MNSINTNKPKPKETLDRREIGFLILIGLVLATLLITFITRSSILIGNCQNNVPSEFCNNPAGDFAVEPDSSSYNVISGCGVDENSPCIFPNISTISEAIKQCNLLPNICNRFIHKNNTMTVVSLTGDTIESPGNHMFVRQNGVTFQGSGNINNSYIYTDVLGSSTSNTSNGGETAMGSNDSSSFTGSETSYNQMVSSSFTAATSSGSTPISSGSGSYSY